MPSSTTLQKTDEIASVSVGASNLANWTNPQNARLDDGSYASIIPNVRWVGTQWLHIDNWGFNIPPAATITDIKMYAKTWRSGGTNGDVYWDVMAVKNGGRSSGYSWYYPLDTNSTTFKSFNHGNLWDETWTPANINDPSFGMIFAGSCGTDNVNTGDLNFLSAVSTGSGAAWVNPTYAIGTNNLRASCTAPGSGANNANNYQYLELTGLGLSIPLDAVISDITVWIERYRTGGTTGQIRDNSIRLMKAGTPVGNNYANTIANWPTIDIWASYPSGTSDYLWGTSWTPADINDPGFGVSIRVIGSTATTNRQAHIDDVLVDIGYRSQGDRTVYINTVKIEVTYSGAVEISSSITQTAAHFIAIDISSGGAEKLFSMSIAQIEALALSKARERNIEFSQAEIEAIAIDALNRTRVSSLSIPASVAYSIAIDVEAGLSEKLFSMSIYEICSVVEEIARGRNVQISSSDAEIISIDILNRARTTTFTQSKTITLNKTLSRERNINTDISETWAQTTSVKRERGVVIPMLNQITTMITLGRVKLMNFISNQTEGNSFFMSRARRASLSMAELESVQASFGRSRVFVTPISESQAMVTNFGRLREQISTIAQTQSVQTALGRLREIVQSISNTTDYTFTIRILAKNPHSAILSWEEWQNINGVPTLVQRTEEIQFGINKYTTVTMTMDFSNVVQLLQQYSSNITISEESATEVVVPNNTL